jgi:hypothetical protein
MDATTQFLRGHRGRVDLVTVSLWGNDANAFVASCNGDVRCIIDGAPAAIARLAGNLDNILQPTRARRYWPIWPRPLLADRAYCATPYKRSPASPNPGTM